MRRYFVLSLGSVLAGAMLVSAAAADPYFRREQIGSWTNVEYTTAFVGTTTRTTLMTRI